MKRIVALVYLIFKTDKKQTTPYFATCLIITLIVAINILSVAVVLNVSSSSTTLYLIKDENLNRWINTIIQGTLLWFFFFFLFPRNKLEGYDFSEIQLKKARRNLIIVIIMTIVLMGIVLVQYGIRQGTI